LACFLRGSANTEPDIQAPRGTGDDHGSKEEASDSTKMMKPSTPAVETGIVDAIKEPASRVLRVLSFFWLLRARARRVTILVRAPMLRCKHGHDRMLNKMRTAMNNALFVLGEVFQAINIVRAPLLVAIVTGVILCIPDQTIEIYRILAIDYADKVTQVWIAFATLLVVAFFFSQFAYHLAVVNSATLRSKCGLGTLAALPSLCAIVIPIGAAYGTYVANVPPIAIGPLASQSIAYNDYANAIAPIGSRLTLATVICVMIGVAALAFSVRTVLKDQVFHKRYLNSQWSILGVYPTMLFLVFAGVSITGFTKNGDTLPERIGVVTIVLQFSILVAFFASLLSLYYYRYRIPFITGIVLLAVGFSAANINDNHVIGIIAYPPRQSKAVEYSFVEWYQGRADRARFEESGNPYPVFLVSAAGGGIYAAYHAAQVLARLADRCPNFAQHVFAISGVSGGSLGAAVFSSLAKDLAANGPPEYCQFDRGQPGPFEKHARQMLSHDFLAPIVAGGLFPDFFQRFVPRPIQAFDRAKNFESTITAAWKETMPSSPNHFADPFLDLWQADGASPALILNTTHVDGGFRVPITAFEIGTRWMMFNDDKIAGVVEFHRLLAGGANIDIPLVNYPALKQDIDLATAVSISARFPWIMPAATVPADVVKTIWLNAAETKSEDRGIKNVRLVDGGYYDNSGMDTLNELLQRLSIFETAQQPDAVKKHPYVKFYVVSIAGFSGTAEQPWQGVSELLSPIRTMLSTREQKGSDAFFHNWISELACHQTNPNSCPLTYEKWFLLDQSDFQFPLGWQLSRATRSLIDLQAGDPRDYYPQQTIEFTNTNSQTRIGAFRATANKSACEIVHLLHPIKVDSRDCQSDRGTAFAQKRFHEAINEYNAVLKFNPKSARAYASRGDAYEQKSDYGSAIADYDRAIALDPAYDEARALRGRVYLHEGQYDLAIADENVAIRLNDNRLDYYEYRGDAYNMKGDFDGAIADYTEIIKSKPVGLADSQIAKRARAYAGKGDYDSAIADYTTAITYDPWNKNYLLERANVYKAKGDLAHANSDINSAQHLGKDD
jgi:tetratricopeptide (TPR) repeat protein